MVRNNFIVPHHTHDIEPAAHEFSTVPPSHRAHQRGRYLPMGLHALPSPRVGPSHRLSGAACEFVELRAHLVQRRGADVADPLLHATAIDGP